MGRLIDCDNAYNAIQITSDKFGVASMVVWRAMCNMLSQIPTENAIRIPENATNGDMLKAIFPQWNLREGIGFEYKLFGEKHKFEGLVDEDWWNAPYRIKEDNENGRAD